MSFDVNVLSSKPVIREAASMQNDGGGGNLGYMEQGSQQKEKEKKYLDDVSIFNKKDEIDTFGLPKDLEISEEDLGFSFAKFIAKLIQTFKSFFAKKN